MTATTIGNFILEKIRYGISATAFVFGLIGFAIGYVLPPPVVLCFLFPLSTVLLIHANLSNLYSVALIERVVASERNASIFVDTVASMAEVRSMDWLIVMKTSDLLKAVRKAINGDASRRGIEIELASRKES
jgi:hypothetical protein